MGYSYHKITLETNIGPQNLGSLLIKWYQSKFKLPSSDYNLILSCLNTTVPHTNARSTLSKVLIWGLHDLMKQKEHSGLLTRYIYKWEDFLNTYYFFTTKKKLKPVPYWVKKTEKNLFCWTGNNLPNQLFLF